MAEIENINFQLGEIIKDMNIPVVEGKGSYSDYLCCVASGMIQFVCVRTGRESYRSLTADHICIHPGSVMFRQDPVFIVAGEIVRTSRIFAMSVSPLTRPMLDQINPKLYERLMACKSEKPAATEISVKKQKNAVVSDKNKKSKNKNGNLNQTEQISDEQLKENALSIGDFLFETVKIKGKKTAILPIDYFKLAVMQEKDQNKLNNMGNLLGLIKTKDNGVLLEGEKISLIISITKKINISPISEKKWNRKMNANIFDPIGKEQIIDSLSWILRTTIAKQKNREYGFITLYTDQKGSYWYKVSRGFSTALAETHASLETLLEENADFTAEEQKAINDSLRLVNSFYE